MHNSMITDSKYSSIILHYCTHLKKRWTILPVHTACFATQHCLMSHASLLLNIE